MCLDFKLIYGKIWEEISHEKKNRLENEIN